MVIFSRTGGNFKGGKGLDILRTGGHTGTLIGSSLPHPDSPHTDAGNMLCLGFYHTDMVQRRYVCFMKFLNFDEF